MDKLIHLPQKIIEVLKILFWNFWQTFNSPAFRQDVDFAADFALIFAVFGGLGLFVYHEAKLRRAPKIKFKLDIKEKPQEAPIDFSKADLKYSNKYAVAVALRNEGRDIAKGVFFYLAFNDLVEITNVDFFPDGIQNPTPGKALFLYNHPNDLPNWAPWIEYLGLHITIKRPRKKAEAEGEQGDKPFHVGRVDFQGGGEDRLNHSWIVFDPVNETFSFRAIKDLRKEMPLGVYNVD